MGRGRKKGGKQNQQQEHQRKATNKRKTGLYKGARIQCDNILRMHPS